MAKRCISRALLIVLSVGLVMAAIAANGTDAYAAENKPTLSTEYKVMTVGSKINVDLAAGNWIIKSIKVTSSDKGVVTAKKNNLYSVALKGKGEGTATVKAKVKAYRYKGSKKSKTKTFNLKCKVKVMDSSGFSQYVYTDEKGRKCFKYTGTGDTCIVVPEGVQVIAGFGNSVFDRNYDVTYVYIPTTVQTMVSGNINNCEETNWDMTKYNLLYQLPNLQTVEGGNYSYQCNGSTVTRPGNITVWSNSELVPYNLKSRSVYI